VVWFESAIKSRNYEKLFLFTLPEEWSDEKSHFSAK
jgi:hypothetical protein